MKQVDRSMRLLQSRVEAPGNTVGVYRQRRINMYTKGLRQKLAQASLALDRIEALVDAVLSTASTGTQGQVSYLEQIWYHNDAFWAFMFSVFEILAQVVNQTEELGLDEEAVSFARVTNKLRLTVPSPPLGKRLEEIKKSRLYKNVTMYRHSSTHRRPICVGRSTRALEVPDAYDTTGFRETLILLCDNARLAKPKFNQKREIRAYCRKSLDGAQEIIQDVVDVLIN